MMIFNFEMPTIALFFEQTVPVRGIIALVKDIPGTRLKLQIGNSWTFYKNSMSNLKFLNFKSIFLTLFKFFRFNLTYIFNQIKT